jgi:hypothetical protein
MDRWQGGSERDLGAMWKSHAKPAKAAPASLEDFEAFRAALSADLLAFKERMEGELSRMVRQLNYLSNEVDELGKDVKASWDAGTENSAQILQLRAHCGLPLLPPGPL